jgi:hypothetical protein
VLVRTELGALVGDRTVKRGDADDADARGAADLRRVQDPRLHSEHLVGREPRCLGWVPDAATVATHE